MYVYVINKRGTPLMPCSPRTARLLLKADKARVIRRTPFTIRLNYGSSGYKQAISLGIDAGSKTIGVSAITDKRELYAAEVMLRTDVSKLLATRRELRRARRNRTTRYRAPRFDNRVKSKSKSWLAPSIEQKIDTHLSVIADVHKLLPISRIVVETAAFDVQKIKNPSIEGTEYQQGEQLGFWNVREYVLWRDGHKCQHCKGKSGDDILNVHHIESRKTGGDAPTNLITLCATCHKAYHQGKIKLKVKRGASFKDAAFMGIMRWTVYRRLQQLYDNVSMTYGYLTKHERIKHSLEKAHAVDARCISGNATATPSDVIYTQRAVRRHNRQIHKLTINKGGSRKLNQAPKYVHGYQLFDKVMCNGVECFVFARRRSGSFDVRTIDGAKVSAGISYKKLRLLEKRRTLLTERRKRSLLKPRVSMATAWQRLTSEQQKHYLYSMRGVAAYNRMCTEGKKGKSDDK